MKKIPTVSVAARSVVGFSLSQANTPVPHGARQFEVDFPESS